MDDDPINWQAEEDERRYRNEARIYNTVTSMVMSIQNDFSPQDLDCCYRVARHIIDDRIRMAHSPGR